MAMISKYHVYSQELDSKDIGGGFMIRFYFLIALIMLCIPDISYAGCYIATDWSGYAVCDTEQEASSLALQRCNAYRDQIISTGGHCVEGGQGTFTACFTDNSHINGNTQLNMAGAGFFENPVTEWLCYSTYVDWGCSIVASLEGDPVIYKGNGSALVVNRLSSNTGDIVWEVEIAGKVTASGRETVDGTSPRANRGPLDAFWDGKDNNGLFVPAGTYTATLTAKTSSNECLTHATFTVTVMNACTDGETRSCYNGPTGTADVGICRSGSQLCVDGMWDSNCQGEILPEEEQCDTNDHNCNGTTADGFECKPGESKNCYNGPAGTSGVGECRNGTQSCNNSCQWDTACTGSVVPILEICDDKDNDCDGQSDEGFDCRNGESRECYDGPSGTNLFGICHSGNKVCNNCNWDTAVCEGQQLPEQEKCDGKDHNCNNEKDEGCDECKDESGQDTAGDE